MPRPRSEYPNSRERRTVQISDAHWMGLQLVADVNHTSISAILRKASELYMERYGLAIVDGELTINQRLWPTEVIEKRQRSSNEISGGDQNLPGGPN